MILMGGLVTAAGRVFVGWRDSAAGTPPSLGAHALRRRTSGLDHHAGRCRVGVLEGRLDKVRTNFNRRGSGIGYITADAGGIILLVALILGGIGVRRARSGGGTGLLKASTVLAAVLIAVYAVSVWAMGGKPS
jgi:hypothetical protein